MHNNGGDGFRVSLYLAVRAIRRGNRNTLALTILIIALVVVMMNFLTMIIGGVVTLYNQQMIDYQYGDVSVQPREKALYIDNADALVKEIRRMPGVLGVTSHMSTGTTITNTRNGKFQTKSLVAFSPRDERSVTKFDRAMLSGDYLSEGDEGQILIGDLLAGDEDEKKDKIPSLGGVKVGDHIEVAYSNGVVKDYRVKGIFKTDGVMIDSSAFVTRAEMDSVMHTNGKATEILVKGSSAQDAEKLKLTLYEYGVQEQVKTWQERGSGIIGDAIASFNLIGTIMTVVSLIVASVVVFIVTFINIINRRKQIGIMKAIGIRKQTIIGSYLIQVLFLCSAGMMAGAFLLNAICLFLTWYPLHFPMGFITPSVDYGGLVISMIALFIVAVVSGYLPSSQVASEEILDAMRGG
ncbi:MAG: ABC transporter permease [Methanomicrobiales archaeon]|nr:ABC transporter permease [Methanomicrobiales archaeon]